MFTLTPKFDRPLKIFQVPASWFRKVTAFLNHVCAGDFIDVDLPEEPDESASVTISLDYDALKQQLEFDGFSTGGERNGPEIGDETSTEPLPSTESYDTQTWSADSGTGIKILLPSRITPVGSGHVVFFRWLSYSSTGVLFAVSEEVKHVVLRA